MATKKMPAKAMKKSMTTSKVKEPSGAQESGVKKKRLTKVDAIKSAFKK